MELKEEIKDSQQKEEVKKEEQKEEKHLPFECEECGDDGKHCVKKPDEKQHINHENNNELKKEQTKEKKEQCCCKVCNEHDKKTGEKSQPQTETQLKEENQKLKEKINHLETQNLTEKLKYQADFENFQKRIRKEKITSLKYASMNLINDLFVGLLFFSP